MKQQRNKLYQTICPKNTRIDHDVLESVLTLAVELAREGREGRRIGTIFTISASDAVLNRSRPLILDPLYGHPDELKQVDDPNARETVKELAQLDGAFVVSNKGIVRSACRYLNVSAEGVELPLGLGSRHIAGASISQQTETIAVVVSESALVRVFDKGELVNEIIPEVWMLARHTPFIKGETTVKADQDITVVSKAE